MAADEIYKRETVLHCPRDASRLGVIPLDGARVHECAQCVGRFFDQSEMFTVLGAHGDPSFWDRPECTSAVVGSDIVCPRCRAPMLLTTLRTPSMGPYRGEGENVEIDRCTRCRGIWLDPGEAERVVAIGRWMISKIEAERARAEEELARMSEPDFHAVESPLAAIARFLGRLAGAPPSE